MPGYRAAVATAVEMAVVVRVRVVVEATVVVSKVVADCTSCWLGPEFRSEATQISFTAKFGWLSPKFREFARKFHPNFAK